MRSVRILLVIALCAICTRLTAQVVFNSSAGRLTSSNRTGPLSLVGPTLSDVQALTSSQNGDAGSQGLGIIQSKSSAGGARMAGAAFDRDRSFTIRYENGSIFTGSLASGAPRGKPLGSLMFQETVNGMLTGPGYTPWIVAGQTVDLSAGGNCNGECNGTNDGSPRTFAAAPTLSAAPELGTLTLVGSGLVSLGVFARRRLKRTAS
jgi:hypothetical protein